MLSGGGSNNKSGSSPTPAVELPLLSTIQSLPKEIRNLLAGGIAGMIAKSFVAPVDHKNLIPSNIGTISFTRRTQGGILYHRKGGNRRVVEGEYCHHDTCFSIFGDTIYDV